MDIAALLAAPRPGAMFNRSVRGHHHRMGDENAYHSTNFVPSTPADRSATPRHSAEPLPGDRLQAEYYLGLLKLNLKRIDYRIEKCRAAITFSQAAGDIENVIGFRDLLRLEQEERRTVEGLIARLHRRFPPSNPAP